MAVKKQLWCVICEQQPAHGTFVRVYADDCVIATDPNKPKVLVCPDCTEKYKGSLAPPKDERGTRWAFEPGLTYVVPKG